MAVMDNIREQDTAPAGSSARGTGAQYLAAVRMFLVLTLVLGLAYPLAITVVAHLPGLSGAADGSLVSSGGRVVGSSLLAQSFQDKDGKPLAVWFQPRPSAAGADGWDGASSGASNLGPTNPDLVKAITDRKAQVAAFNSVAGHTVTQAQVPADAVTASGSGLDPQISVAYADLQVDRVALARHLDATAVARLVSQDTQGRSLGFVGEPRVNVLLLNRDLAELAARG